MRAAGMLCGTESVLLVSLILIIDYTSALPLQFLPPIPGYIPVYIRNGNQPLEEINLALAEAFNERQAIGKNDEDSQSDSILSRIEYNPSIRISADEDDQQSGEISSSEKSWEKNVARSFSLDSEGPQTYAAFMADGAYDDGPREKLTKEQQKEKSKDRRKVVELEKSSKPDFNVGVDSATIPKLVPAKDFQNQKDDELKQQGSSSVGKSWEEDKIIVKRKPLSVSKEAFIEVSNIPAKEKDDLEQLAAEVEKEEFRPNEVADPNPNYPELPAEITQDHNRQDVGLAVENPQDNNDRSEQLKETSEKSENTKLSDSSVENVRNASESFEPHAEKSDENSEKVPTS